MSVHQEMETFTRTSSRGSSAPTSGAFTLHANFGTTATIGSFVGGECRFSAIVTCGGTGQGATPTVVYTYPNGGWKDANGAAIVPVAQVTRHLGASQLTVGWTVTAITTTAVTFQFNGTASGTETYGFACELGA